MRGGANRCSLGTLGRGLRAGAYARVRLPQLGLGERRLQHARAAHWTVAPLLPRRCMWIGRRRLREAGGAWRANTAAGFGGRLGLSGQFLLLSFGEADGTALGPAFPFGRGHKMAAAGGGVTARVRGARDPPPFVSGHVRGPSGLGWGPPRSTCGRGRSSRKASGRLGVGPFPHQLHCARPVDLVRAGLGGSFAG